MVVFLSVWLITPDVYKQVGTLEITHQVSPQGTVSKGWEWRPSGLGSQDGGGWEWVYNSQSDWVEIELKSGNRENAVVARMRSREYWKGSKLPPNEPWFREPSTINGMEYTDPNNKIHLLSWKPVK